ncbi:hypothetical protein Bca4012_103289 [Brassica carinata]
MERGGSNLSDKGLNLGGSWQQGHSATTIPVGVFKSSAKDSTALGGNNNSRRSSGASASGLSQRHISVLVELILGHLRYLLTDVPPQPNSPPDNVLRRIDRERVLDLKKGLLPASVHGKLRESCSQSVPGRHAACALAALAARAVRQQSAGWNWDLEPSPQSQSFSEVTDPFCRLPLPTLFHRPEAVHLGDLMRL